MQKGIGFDIELEAAEVYSDSKWLSFIIRQLLTNAVKYSEASGYHDQKLSATKRTNNP